MFGSDWKVALSRWIEFTSEDSRRSKCTAESAIKKGNLSNVYYIQFRSDENQSGKKDEILLFNLQGYVRYKRVKVWLEQN